MGLDSRCMGMMLGVVALLAIAGAGRAGAVAPSGACCTPSGGCQSVAPDICERDLSGIYVGDGVLCENIQCDARVAAPLLSIFGIVATVGALGGLGVFRLLRRKRDAR